MNEVTPGITGYRTDPRSSRSTAQKLNNLQPCADATQIGRSKNFSDDACRIVLHPSQRMGIARRPRRQDLEFHGEAIRSKASGPGLVRGRAAQINLVWWQPAPNFDLTHR